MQAKCSHSGKIVSLCWGMLWFSGLGLGRQRSGLVPDEVEFPALQQFPLHLVTRLQADGGGQGQGKTDIQPGFLSARAHGLNAQRISDFHIFFESSNDFSGLF